MAKIDVIIEPLEHFEGLELPEYESDGASGFDIRAAVVETVVIKPSERVLIPTGLKVELPNDYEIQIRPRSGNAWKKGVTVLNTPGTIDDDYRGELGVLLINLSNEDFVVKRGMRIAQGVLAQVPKANFVVGKVEETRRGTGGFGHTGVN